MDNPVSTPRRPAGIAVRCPVTASIGLRSVIGILSLAILTASSQAQPYPTTTTTPAVKKIFFFDDEDVLYRSGTERLLHPLEKIPHPGLIPQGAIGTEPGRQPWEGYVAYVSVYRKPDLPNGQPPEGPRYQMWYQGHSSKKKTSDDRKRSMVNYAYSDDGIIWKRPGISPGTQGLGMYDFVQNLVFNDGGTPDEKSDDTYDTVPPPNPNDITQNGTNYTYYPASKTNIVLIGSGGRGDRFGNSVIVEPNDPNPNRRYKMVMSDWANTTSGSSINDAGTFPHNVVPNLNSDPDGVGVGLVVAFSPDGIHWTKVSDNTNIGYPGPSILSRMCAGATGQPPTTVEHANNPLDYVDQGIKKYWRMPLTISDALDVFYDPARNKYVIYGKMWNHSHAGEMSWKHAMGRIESSDFINWTPPELILTTGDYDGPNIKFHTSPVFYYEGIYLSLNQIYSDPIYTDVTNQWAERVYIELMSSRNAFDWDRNFIGLPILPNGAVSDTIPFGTSGYDREFDSRDIFTNSTPVILPDEMRFYYGAYGAGTGLGMAKTKRDRLVSIKSQMPFGSGSSTYKAGLVTLKKVDLTGYSSIAINAKTDTGEAIPGEIRVELLNKEGRPIPNFTKLDAIPLTGDASPPYSTSVQGDPLNRKVAWTGATLANLSSSDRKECVIRIYLKNSDVFSCSLVP